VVNSLEHRRKCTWGTDILVLINSKIQSCTMLPFIL
jgi:hypothetical protein